MAKKAAGSLRPLKTRDRRQPGRRHPFPVRLLDGLATGLGRVPRLVRMVIAGVIAACVTAALGVALFSVLYLLPSSRLPQDILLIVWAALMLVGALMYWVGWRVLLGFDLEGQRLQPTRAAALWVVFGLAVFAGLVAFGAYTAITAAQP
jgi:hypothetical protein